MPSRKLVWPAFRNGLRILRNSRKAKFDDNELRLDELFDGNTLQTRCAKLKQLKTTSERVCFRERHSRTAPSPLAVKKISKEMVQASSLFSQQWQRTLDCVLSWWSEPAELLETLLFYISHSQRYLSILRSPARFSISLSVATLCWFYPITLKTLHWLPLEIIITDWLSNCFHGATNISQQKQKMQRKPVV